MLIGKKICRKESNVGNKIMVFHGGELFKSQYSLYEHWL